MEFKKTDKYYKFYILWETLVQRSNEKWAVEILTPVAPGVY